MRAAVFASDTRACVVVGRGILLGIFRSTRRRVRATAHDPARIAVMRQQNTTAHPPAARHSIRGTRDRGAEPIAHASALEHACLSAPSPHAHLERREARVPEGLQLPRTLRRAHVELLRGRCAPARHVSTPKRTRFVSSAARPPGHVRTGASPDRSPPPATHAPSTASRPLRANASTAPATICTCQLPLPARGRAAVSGRPELFSAPAAGVVRLRLTHACAGCGHEAYHIG